MIEITGWSIGQKCFDKIKELLPQEKTILEFGSGAMSEYLSKLYNLYSIENNPKWLNKYNTNYIYAPLKEINNTGIKWYNIDILLPKIPKNYDLILVDAPTGRKGNISYRYGFFYYKDYFDLKNKILVFDDVNRQRDYNNMLSFSKILGKPFEIFDDDYSKQFGIILT